MDDKSGITVGRCDSFKWKDDATVVRRSIFKMNMDRRKRYERDYLRNRSEIKEELKLDWRKCGF